MAMAMAMVISSLELQQVLDLLGSLPVLQRLPGASFEQIVKFAHLRHFGAGEWIVKEGEPGKGLYIIWKGEADIILKSSDKVSQKHLSPGNHFGHASVAPEKKLHKHDIIARSKVSCVLIPHEQAPYLSPASTWRHQPGELSIVERLLQLEFIEDDLFKAHSMREAPTFWGNMYGGRMVGLALGAASKTVEPALVVHSLHSYFVLGVISSLPIFFKVERTRSGRTFATRHVQATQNGKVCFVMYASFQRAEDGLEHQYPMPNTTPPNELPTYEELLGPVCNDTDLPEYIRLPAIACLKMSETLDLRYFYSRSRFTMEPQEPRQRLWVRTNGKLGDDEALHRCAAGYAFDWSFLETAMMPHNMVVIKHPVVVSSIDHSIWFHRPFRVDDYLLFVTESHRACNSRALCLGRVYTQSGELVASLAQEGIIRVLPIPPKEDVLHAKL